jgi:hypothetical protein
MIALTILSYWVGMAILMWMVLYTGLSFAILCEKIVDFLSATKYR